jgi:diguanylate cyclase (GGDEF)-like protein/PAS domain S-box-containing protein
MDPLYYWVVLLSYAVVNAICLVVILLLWLRIRGRFSGINFWLASYLMQFTGACLILMRESIPEAVPVILANGLLIAGGIVLYIGLERFVGRKGPQVQNAVLLLVFLAVHSYFFFISPNLAARIINLSLALLVFSFECAWLLLRRVEPEMLRFTWGAGAIFIGFVLAALFRIATSLLVPGSNASFFSNGTDMLAIIAHQMLFIALTFTLSLMVNLRLLGELESDLAVRKGMEAALRESEEKFSRAFHSSPDAILISRARDGRLLEVNDSFCRLTKYSREESIGSSPLALSLWVNPADEECCYAALLEHRRVRELEYEFRTKTGETIECLYSGELIDLAGELHILSVVRDITERKQALEILRRSEAHFREVFENSAQGLFIIDVLENGNFRIHESNLAQEKLSGIPRASVDGRLLAEGFSADAAGLIRGFCLRCMEEGTPISVEEGFSLPGGPKFVHATFTPVRDEKGRIYRIIGSTLDISELKQVEEILRLRLNLWEYAAAHTSEELMREALDEIGEITGSPIGFFHFVREDQKTIALKAWSTRTVEEFCRAEPPDTHYPLEEAGVWADAVRQKKPVIHNDYASLPGRRGMPEGHAALVRELVVPTLREGKVVSVLGVGNKPTEYDERDVELVAYIADIVWVIVDRKRTEEEIQHLQSKLREMAIHDSLTGLYNRHYLSETLKRELARAVREKYPVSFIMIDIDHFKRVNDAFGHKAGDAVLQNLSALLRKNSRAGDILVRYGGEEFLAILPKVKAEAARKVAEKWRKDFLASTMLLEYGGVTPTISCGVAAFPQHGESDSDLIAVADQAMYQAKAAGRNRSVVWTAPRKK